ncbi:hypothetical protein RJ639_030501 [Escallonia herrerae]|uniref:TFIID subunit TAF5 NTD2 domain-containing protein n=1 Tax=Escallonia herrerae TaxID=1293975 RepID=A0AA89BB35_9ASTE|nr:hypothetical protein RJ639_030501 [Escallonia herrerae]
MDEEEIEKTVIAYLKKKGFKQTELAFQQEQHHSTKTAYSSNSANSHTDPDIAHQILSFSELQSVPAQYEEGYSKLRSWTYSSLDLYKHELLHVLYPVFIHCFMDLVAKGHLQEARAFFNSYREDHEMMHLRDLQKLEGVLSPSHLEEMEFAHSLRQSKVNMKICQLDMGKVEHWLIFFDRHSGGENKGTSGGNAALLVGNDAGSPAQGFASGVAPVYSYELLLQYLHKTQSITMLGIINERINFQVSPGQPSSISDDAEVFMLVGSGQDEANLINQKEVHWGLLEDTIEERLEKAGGLLSESEKTDAEAKEGELEENKKRSVEGGKQGASLKKMKKDKVVGATGKASRTEGSTVSSAPRVKPELSLPAIPTEVEHSILEDLRNRVQLSSVALPSVSFYTFINTHNGLNCSSISHDGSLVAGGFSDSSVKVWDMAKLGQQTGSCIHASMHSQASLKSSLHYDKRQMLGVKIDADGRVKEDGSNAGAAEIHEDDCGSWLLGFAPSFGVKLPSGLKACFVLSEFLVLAILQGENDLAPTDNVLGSSSGKRCYSLYLGHSGPVYSATFSPFGDYILSSSSDSTIRLWSTKLNANLVCYKGHNYPVWDVQFSPLGHYFASAAHDRTARIWSVERIQPLRIIAGHLSDVDCVQWHANCNYIATGSSDKTVRLWDLQSGECARIFIGHRSMVLSLAMSPDGRYMASGDEDGNIMMWDLSSGRCVTPLVGHTSCVWTLDFSCEGSLLASGSADCTVKLWDVTSSTRVPKTEEVKSGNTTNRLRSLRTLPTKSTPVYALRFSRRNLLFAAGALSAYQ